MAKRSRAERTAGAGARVVGTGAGSFFNNPAVIVIALLLGGLFIFRDKISESFQGVFENFKFPEIPNPFENFTNPFADFKFPEFTFPEFTNPFEDFVFPTFENPFADFVLPDFTSQFEGFNQQFQDLFSGFQLQLNNLFGTDIEQDLTMVENTGATQAQIDACQCGASIIQDSFGNVNLTCHACEATDIQLPSQDPALNVPDTSGQAFGGLLDFLGLTPAQEFALGKGLSPEQEEQIIVPIENVNVIGGGQSFIGGTTTFGDSSNIVDTLTEVLNLFPNLTASQAANALAEFPNLTPNQFRLINPNVPSISSAGGDPEQIFNNTSDPNLSGLTPEQIFQKLFGNIQNF